MSIKKLTVHNFRSIEKLDIELAPENKVICFVGENGSAKTSLLSLITEAIVSRTKLIFPNYKNKENRYRLVSVEEIQHGKQFYSFEMDYSSIKEKSFNFKKLLAENNSVALDVYSKAIQNIDLPSIGFPLSEISTLEHLDSSQDFLNQHVFLLRPGNRYENYSYDLLDGVKKTDLMINTNLSEHMPYPFTVSHSGDDIQSTILNILFDAQIGYTQSRISFEKISKILGAITGKEFGQIQVTSMPYRQLVSSTIGKFSALSQGELDLLVTISSILKQQLFLYNRYSNGEREEFNIETAFDIPGIVLIDEVDLHLHPKAQETYIRILTSFFPNIQFVITTHSPFIIRGLPTNSKVVSLPSGRVFSDNFQAMDIDSITNIIFGLSGRFSDGTEDKISRFRSEIIKEAPNKDTLKSIFIDLTGSDSARDELELYIASYGNEEIKDFVLGN